MAIYRVTKDIGFRLEQHVEADTRELAMAIAAKYSNWVNDCGKIEPYYDAFEIDAETAEQMKEEYLDEDEDTDILLVAANHPVTEADIPWHRAEEE